MSLADKIAVSPTWLQGDVAAALSALVWPWQSRQDLDKDTRRRVTAAYETLRKLMPKPTGYIVVANACGTRRVVEAKTFGEAHVVADGLNEADWDHICIQAEVDGLRWAVEVLK